MIFPRISTVLVNCSINKFRLFKNIFSGHSTYRRLSWQYTSYFLRWWKKYSGGKKSGRRFCELSTGQYSTDVAGNKGNKCYSITVTNYKALLGNQEFIVKKTVVKPKHELLSFVQLKGEETPNDKYNRLNFIEKNDPPEFDLPVENQLFKTEDSVTSPDNSLPFGHSIKTSGPMKDSANVKSANDDEISSKASSSKPNCIGTHNSHGKNRKRNPDTLILNPKQPNLRTIFHFRDKNIHVIEPSGFDNMDLACKYIMQVSDKYSPYKPGRINFIKFFKIQPKEAKILGKTFESIVLKEQTSVCLDKNSEKLWVKMDNEQFIPPEVPQSTLDDNLLFSEVDKNDPIVTKIPIKRDTLIEESVIPNKSILNIINSIDKSAVIIHKDLYITNKIIQKIKDEEKKKEKEKTIETKSYFEDQNFIFHFDLSGEWEQKSLSPLANECELSDKTSEFSDFLNFFLFPRPLLAALQGISRCLSRDVGDLDLLMFSHAGTPSYKRITTTDIIKKIAALVEKEKYARKSSAKGKQDDIIVKKETVKKPQPSQNPHTTKCSENNSLERIGNLMLGNTALLITFRQNESLPKFPDPVLDSELNFDVAEDGHQTNNSSAACAPTDSEGSLVGPGVMGLVIFPKKIRSIETRVMHDIEDSGLPEDSKMSEQIRENTVIPMEIPKILPSTGVLPPSDPEDNKSFDFSLSPSYKRDEIETSNNAISDIFTSSEGKSLVDESLECLMCSKGKETSDTTEQVEVEDKTKIISKDKILKTGKPSDVDHIAKTSINIEKRNNITDIKVTETETFKDNRLPISFSTETHYQLFGTTPSIQKKVKEFDDVKGKLLSSFGSPNNPTTKDPQIDSPKHDGVPQTTSEVSDHPQKQENNEKSDRKNTFYLRSERNKISRRVKKLKVSTFTPQENSKTETTIKQPKHKKDKTIITSEQIQPISKPTIADMSSRSSRKDSSSQKAIDHYVHLLEINKKSAKMTNNPRKKRPRGIIDHKSLSSRDRKILKDIMKDIKKKTKSKTEEMRASPHEAKTPLKPAIKNENLKLNIVDNKIDNTNNIIEVKKPEPNFNKKSTIHNSRMGASEKSTSLDHSKLKKSASATGVKSSLDAAEVKRGSDNVVIKDEKSALRNIKSCTQDPNSNDKELAKSQSLNEGQKSKTHIQIDPDKSKFIKSSSSVNALPKSVSIPKKVTTPKTTIEFIKISNESQKTANPSTKYKEDKKITVIENKSIKNIGDIKEIFQNKLLDKAKSKIELKNPINYHFRKPKKLANPLMTSKLKKSKSPRRKISRKEKFQTEDSSVKRKVKNIMKAQTFENKSCQKHLKTSNASEQMNQVPKKDLNESGTVSKISSHHFTKSEVKSNRRVKSPRDAKTLKSTSESQSSLKKELTKQKSNISMSQSVSDIVSKKIKGAKFSETKLQGPTAKRSATPVPKTATKPDPSSVKSTISGKSSQASMTPLSPSTRDSLAKRNVKPENKSSETKNSSVPKISVSTVPAPVKTQPSSVPLSSVKPTSRVSEPPKSSENLEHWNSEGDKSKLARFPILLVDLDKMTKEIKPDLYAKKCRSCSVPIDQVIKFPLMNAKKSKVFNCPHSVLKVCPSKDPNLQKELAFIPPVTKILNVTLPKKSRDVLKTWWKNMQKELGENGFKEFYRGEMSRGTQFHNLVQDHLLWSGETGSGPSMPCFRSITSVLGDVTDLAVINSHVIHSSLAYRGVVDCIATYRKEPVVIDWKRLASKEAKSKGSFESSLQQLSAYVGAVNFDSNYKFQVNGGLLVLAYSDGSEADTVHLKGGQLEAAWAKWLERLQRYHLHIKNQEKK